MLSKEVFYGQAGGGATGRDAVVETTPDEGDVAGGELECRVRVIEPQPGMTPDDGVDGERDGAGKAQPPRGSRD